MIVTVLFTAIVAPFLWIAMHFLEEWLLRWRCPPGSKLPPMPPMSSIRGHVEILGRDSYRTKCVQWAKDYGPVLCQGARFYVYTKSFLTRRKACAGDLLISPTLFNLALIGHSKRLPCIEDINGITFGENITIWCSGGSDGQVQRSLEVIYTDEDHLRPTCLRCSPTKPELLPYRPTRRGPKHRAGNLSMSARSSSTPYDGAAI
ncbi:hypothetical protein HPB50_018712 [Hyalomma asiaticum]|uniref:Uncharacterized protein n=1 Tax=Hyalomma asiaticum TaxID=266040 RepID=A0ACB7RZY2_HYAAI|nr:hypothetical protein HPB50_018712 [Hyalomma asiaticum]